MLSVLRAVPLAASSASAWSSGLQSVPASQQAEVAEAFRRF